ncbi:MAG: VWA domain-containing protein [Bryobacteraceae bacterium]
MSIPAFLLVCATAAWPAERISADQLESIVTSACSHGAPDAQIANRLAHIELTGRLPLGRLESLLALPIGPRTRDVLQIAADASAFLDQPPGQSQPPEAATAEQQQEMLARVREYTLGYIRALPDFVAYKMTRRFDDYPFPNGRTEVWHNLTFRDSGAGQLSYNNGVESYVDNAAAHGDPEIPERHGLSSFGEFGSIVGALFWSDSHIQLTWGYWEPVSDKRLAVFHYAIPAEHSRYTVSYCCDPAEGGSIAAAYRGDLALDPATGSVWRVTREALDLPRNFPTHWVKTIVDYRPVTIARASYLLPVRSMTYSESTLRNDARGVNTVRYWNDVRFVHYQRFAAEANLLTGAETHAPAGDESLPQQAPEPWLETDRAAKDSEPPVQTSPPSQSGVATIRASVQLVEVPVIVKNGHGEPETGLKKEDFEVYDNGVRQDVRVFLKENSELKAADTKAPAVSRDQVFSNADMDRRMPGDSTFILIDTLGMDWAERAYARIEILRFLRNFPEGAPSHASLVVGSKFIPLQETNQIVKHLAAGPDFALNPFGFRPSGEAAKWRCPMSLSAAEFYLKAFAGLAEHLAAIPGRKSVIWATAGFALVNFAAQESCTQFTPALLRILNNANVAVYPIDAPGLKTAFADATTKVPTQEGVPTYDPAFVKSASETHAAPIYANKSTMLELSDGTGGRAFLNSNRIASDLQTALEDPRGSYRLGFYPELQNDGRYHRILVKIAGRTDLYARYREGYFDNAAPAEKKGILQSAVEDTMDATGIPLTAELEKNGGKCEMKLRIGLRPVALKEEGGRYSGKLEILVAERNDAPAAPGSFAMKLEQTLGLQLKQETYEQTMRDGFPYRYSFTHKSTITSLRVAVYDPGSGAVGSLTVPVAGCGK